MSWLTTVLVRAGFLFVRLGRGFKFRLGFLAISAGVVSGGCGPAQDGILLAPASISAAQRRPVGPEERLAVLQENPRYFGIAAGGRAVYLTGSHTWNSFQDWGPTDPPRAFDFSAYLDFLESHGHNFIRLYVWEQAAWFPRTEERVFIAPLPYARTGPGLALDDAPRFDLTQFNPDYFRRLRERVEAAGNRRIYVSVMLFNGWSVELKGEMVGNPWRGHPYNRNNNISGIDGDVDGDGEGKEVHTLVNPAVTSLQKAYLRKVVETVGDLDNVLWEISNESHPGAAEWQYAMIHTVKSVEASRGKSHPVGMTSMWPEPPEKNKSLFESPADWISPHTNATDRYEDDPPPSTGRKVILSDTDHIWGVGGNPRWVWMSFTRGLNTLFMDPYVTAIRKNLPAWPSSAAEGAVSASSPAPEWENIRRAMGYARALADRVDLAAMKPMAELASTRFCLAAPDKEYLVYLPAQDGRLRKFIGLVLKGIVGERAEVDLSAARGALDVEWVDVERGIIFAGDRVTGGRRLEFRAPFAGDAVLHLKVGETVGGAERLVGTEGN